LHRFSHGDQAAKIFGHRVVRVRLFLAAQVVPLRARAATGNPKAKSVGAIQSAKETTYWDRTDRFEAKGVPHACG